MATEQINKVISDGIKLLEEFNNQLIKAGENTAKVAADAEKLNKNIVANSKATKKGADTNKQLTESQREAEKINKQLLTTKAKIENIESEQNKELVKQKQLLAERNKELKNTIKLEDKQLGTLERLELQNAKLRKERKALNLETQKGRTRLKEINGELDKNNKFTKDNNDALGKQKINIGNYGSALDSLPGPLRGVVSGTQAVTKSLLVLAANPIVLTITAIVAGITLLAAAFSKTQKGADTFDKIFAQISATFDVVIGRVAKLADVVGFVLTGKFKKARIAAKEAFTGIRSEIKQAVDEAGDIEDLKISIFEDETEFIKQVSVRRREIQRLIKITRDTTRSFEEQREALIKANELEVANLNQSIELQEKRLQLVRDEMAATPVNLRTREQSRAIAEAEATLNDLTTQSLARQRELLNRVNELENKRVAVKAKQIAEEKAFNKAIKDAETEDVADTSSIDAEIELEQEKADRLVEIDFEKNKELLENSEKLREEKEVLDAKEDEARLQRNEDIKQAALELASTIFDFRINALNAELQAAEGNEKKQSEIRAKIARAEKQQALFKIATNTAIGVTAALTSLPPNIPLSILVGAIGLTKLAGVAARPIPQFAKGVTNFRGGVAELAEEGSEMVKEQSGKVWLAENRGLYNLQQGSTVLTAPQTQKELNDKNIVGELKKTRKAIQNQPRQRNESVFSARQRGYRDGYFASKHRLN